MEKEVKIVYSSHNGVKSPLKYTKPAIKWHIYENRTKIISLHCVGFTWKVIDFGKQPHFLLSLPFFCEKVSCPKKEKENQEIYDHLVEIYSV